MKSLFDFDEAFGRNMEEGENNGTTPLKIKIRTRLKFEDRTKRQNVQKLITELPLPEESLHIVSNGNFDYFTVIPHIIDLSPGPSADFHFATWTMSNQNVQNILNLYDRGIFTSVSALTGEYMRQRGSIKLKKS